MITQHSYLNFYNESDRNNYLKLKYNVIKDFINQITKEDDKQFYELDNLCNFCSNPLHIFDNLTITIGGSKYKSPLCKTCLDERGINYDN